MSVVLGIVCFIILAVLSLRHMSFVVISHPSGHFQGSGCLLPEMWVHTTAHIHNILNIGYWDVDLGTLGIGMWLKQSRQSHLRAYTVGFSEHATLHVYRVWRTFHIFSQHSELTKVNLYHKLQSFWHTHSISLPFFSLTLLNVGQW